MTVADEKAAARRAAKTVRAEAAWAAGPAAADRATANFFGLVGDVRGRVLSAYWPINDEIGTARLLHRAHAEGATCVLPVVTGKREPLTFRAWTPTTTLNPGTFGASIPPDGAPVHRPNLIVAPLLAFDRAGGRLGYGGGFYDRTIAALRGDGHDLSVVGLAFAGQELPSVPRDDTDMLIDGIATEAEAYWCLHPSATHQMGGTA